MSDWLRAAIWAAVLMPLGIVLHEAAHYTGYLAYDLPDPTLSYASGGFSGMRDYWTMLREGERAAAEAIAPIREVGMAALYGPLLTIVIGALGLLFAWRGSLFGGALAFTAFFRIVPIAVFYALGTSEHTDEAHITLTLGISDLLLVGLQLAGFLGSGWLLVRGWNWKVALAVLLGTLVSLAIWMTVLGPLVLP